MLLPPGVNQIAVDKYIISYIIYHIISYHIIYHILYYIISYHIILYIIYYIILYHIILYIIYYIISYIISLYHIIYHIILYHISYHISCAFMTCTNINDNRQYRLPFAFEHDKNFNSVIILITFLFIIREDL